jgi:Replicative DNA helicase
MNNTDELLNKNSFFDIDLPRDEAAERSVLGAMLYDIENIPIVAEVLKEDDFFEPIHKTLFKILLEYYFENANLNTIDRVLLKDFIEKRK